MSELTDKRIKDAIRRKFLRRFFWIGGSALTITVLIWFGILVSRKTAVIAPGEVYEDVGQDHIGLSDTPPKQYNSNPPSSGAHYGTPANWGIYDFEVNDKLFIHNLEHGGIWISYKPSVPSEIVAELKAIVNDFGGLKIVMAPRSSNDADIAVAAWTHIYKFNVSGGHLSDQQKKDIKNFYKARLNRAPEDVPSFMAGVDPKEVK